MIIRLFGLSWLISTQNPTCGEAVAAEVLKSVQYSIHHFGGQCGTGSLGD